MLLESHYVEQRCRKRFPGWWYSTVESSFAEWRPS